MVVMVVREIIQSCDVLHRRPRCHADKNNSCGSFPDIRYRIQIKQRVILGIKIKKDQNRKAKEASVCKGRLMLKVVGFR